MEKKYLFKLYLSWQKPSSGWLIRDLVQVFDEKIKDQYSLKVIDVTENPELAEQADIICTPTLVKELPPPSKRFVIGYFTDKKKLLSVLDLLGE